MDLSIPLWIRKGDIMEKLSIANCYKLMKRIWNYILLLWILVSFVVSRLSFGIIFFDVKNIATYSNLVPFDFMVYLIRNYLMAMEHEAAFSIFEVWFLIRDFILNIVLFVPLGVCLKGLDIPNKKTLIITGGIVCFYEVIQISFRLFNIGTGIFDINDIISAFIGVSLGRIVYNLIYHCIQNQKTR